MESENKYQISYLTNRKQKLEIRSSKAKVPTQAREQ
jgi:hypothetical protein